MIRHSLHDAANMLGAPYIGRSMNPSEMIPGEQSDRPR